MEHRWGVRKTLDVGVTLYIKSKLPSFGRLLDASSSGAYVRTNAALPVMTRLRLALGRDGLRRSAHRIAAYVVRSDGRGIGIEWQEFAPLPVLALMNVRQAPPKRARAQAAFGVIREIAQGRAKGAYPPPIRSNTGSSAISAN